MKKWLKTIITVIIIIGIIAGTFVPVAIQWDTETYSLLETQGEKSTDILNRLYSAFLSEEDKEVYVNGY